MNLGGNDKERGRVPASVSNLISDNVAGRITLWSGDLVFFGGDAPKYGGIATGIP